MNIHVASPDRNAPPEACPALVLIADSRPLSYFPLSLWSWQDAIKAVFLDRVNIVSEYDNFVHSPSFEMRLPSVVSLKSYIKPATHPAFTRFNLFLRDRFECQYCHSSHDLTFDHVIPRSKARRRGKMLLRPARRVTCARADGCRSMLTCIRIKKPIGPRCRTCTRMAERSRRTICTTAGWIFFTGTARWSLEPLQRSLQ